MRTRNTMGELWIGEWLNGVVDGSKTMSQRKLSSVEKRGGGIGVARKVAKSKGLHLLLIIDDKGTKLVAASKTPFKVIC
jgi:hypothetical protein